MGQFAYDFTLMLLHSLWQSALLLMLYKANLLFIRRQQPSYRRNLLLVILLIQLVLSSLTYIIYAYDAQSLQPALLQISTLVSDNYLKAALPFAFYAYLLIVLYKSSMLFYHWKRFKLNCNNSLVKASLDHRLFAINKASELGIQKKVSLWYSDVISSPITFGFFKPVILLPVALLNQLTVKEAEMLILHELTHIKNNDYLLNFILIVSETVFFFNPFIKVLCGYVKLEREKNCDVEVIQSAYSSLTYAEALLKIARFKSDINMFHLAAASGNKQLLNRVVFFTSEKNLHFNKSRYAAITYLFLVLVFILNLFTIRQFNRAPVPGGYEYTASTLPGYNAYTLTASFNDPAAVVVENQKSETPDQTKKIFKNNNLHYTREKSYAVVNPLEEPEVADLDESQFMSVANVDVAPEESKEFIFNEENSATGNKITKAYKMILVNGKWIVQPLWMYTESKLKTDSLMCRDSVARPFHIIQ